jgi:hypothetical protein
VYQLRALNASGEAITSATLKCHGKDAILGDTQHAESWRRIQEIEAPKTPAPDMPPVVKAQPRFVTQLQSPGELQEGQAVHLEATVEPIDDPELKIQW